MFAAELSVSTRPAFFTAVTRVDSKGLAEAAVATGAVAMPVKLPAPEAGTDEQPGPKSMPAGAGTAGPGSRIAARDEATLNRPSSALPRPPAATPSAAA